MYSVLSCTDVPVHVLYYFLLSSVRDEGDQGDGNSVKVTVEITDNAGTGL